MGGMPEPAVVVTGKGEARVLRGHPWVFRSDVARSDAATPGAVVRVIGPRGRPLGFAFHSSRSEIRLRVFAHGESLPADFLRQRLVEAVRWRETIAADAEACRLVHGEGDGLPSLVVDRYGNYLVVQTLSQATEALKDRIVETLVELLHPRGVLERNDPRVRELEGLERRVSLLYGEVPDLVPVEFGGVRFEADLWKGQKTGLFLDQRENHLMSRGYARGRVLDAFTYNGGFALQVAARATEVLAVDVSAESVARVRANAALNGATNVTAREGNVFDVLQELVRAGERFDTIVLDPPAFAKNKASVPNALAGYKEINLRAMRLLSPSGCLVTCSCSYNVNEAMFEGVLHEASLDSHTPLTVIEKRMQGRDHPVLVGVPETHYLKCFILRRVE